MKNGICFLGLPHYAAMTRGAVIASEAKQSTMRSDSHGLLRPTPKAGVCGKPAARLAAQTPETTAERLSKRFALATFALAPLTLSEPSCYDVKAVREAPEQRLISFARITLSRGLFKRLYATPLGVGFQ
ncbi:MAG: hypothetical protein LBF83_02265 [Spirochaetaceae bacterium]|jgi:hypothetical protein|nr:hypothetical protein [Spirochaetaceae bacterium]